MSLPVTGKSVVIDPKGRARAKPGATSCRITRLLRYVVENIYEKIVRIEKNERKRNKKI